MTMATALITGLFYYPSDGTFLELLLWLALFAGALYVAFYAVLFVVAFIQLIFKNIIPDIVSVFKKIVQRLF